MEPLPSITDHHEPLIETEARPRRQGCFDFHRLIDLRPVPIGACSVTERGTGGIVVDREDENRIPDRREGDSIGHTDPVAEQDPQGGQHDTSERGSRSGEKDEPRREEEPRYAPTRGQNRKPEDPPYRVVHPCNVLVPIETGQIWRVIILRQPGIEQKDVGTCAHASVSYTHLTLPTKA